MQAEAIEGRHYRSGQWVSIRTKDGRIVSIQQSERPEHPDRQHRSARPGRTIAPGLVDTHVNGACGLAFHRPLAARDIRRIAEHVWQEGVTSFFPTVMDSEPAVMAEALRSIAVACRADPLLNRSIAGIHVESPFISPEDGPRGAHAPHVVRPPDWREFEAWQQAAEGRIRMVTLSPEWPQSVDFIRRCVKAGVCASVGHTAANEEHIRAAVDAGAIVSTHLGNGAHPVLPPHPHYIWDQLAEDRLWATAIADGFHLPVSVLKIIFRMKGKRALLISDLSSLSGNAPGVYDLHSGSGNVVLTAEGRVHFAHDDRLLAGSARSLKQGVGYIAGNGILPFAEAWEAASVIPAALFQLPARQGLQVGAPADVAVFDRDGNNIAIREVYIGGGQVYGNPDADVERGNRP